MVWVMVAEIRGDVESNGSSHVAAQTWNVKIKFLAIVINPVYVIIIFYKIKV